MNLTQREAAGWASVDPSPLEAPMDRRTRLRAVLTVALLLGGAPLAATAGVLLGDAVHRAVPGGVPGVVPGLVNDLLGRRFGTEGARPADARPADNRPADTRPDDAHPGDTRTYAR
ncbi:hypothetical protein ABTZ03_15955 [Kitasatospora sp. NPDC096077]|uniref:hypothetical protein n=1 Tax=Kitasatospora sp. NPDC096077 TaxID=3155544 RepID=UPI00332BD587